MGLRPSSKVTFHGKNYNTGWLGHYNTDIHIYIYISYFFDNILGILGWAPVRNRDDLSLGFMVDILK